MKPIFRPDLIVNLKPPVALPVSLLVLGAIGTVSFAQSAPVAPKPQVATPVLISELRTSGPKGAQDSYIELFNAAPKALSLAGWTLRFRDEKGVLASVKLAPGTQIGARGHLLLTGRDYSLQALARGDARLPTQIGGGIGLFDVKGQLIDAVGPRAGDASSREGAGLPDFVFAAELPGSVRPAAQGAVDPAIEKQAVPQFAVVRRALDGEPQDTGDNVQDFAIVSESGALFDQKVEIGAPGPEDALSERLRPVVTALAAAPNGAAAQPQAIALQSDPDRTSMRRARRDVGLLQTFGSMTLRYRFVNTTPNVLKTLSFRVNSITSDPDPDPAFAASADVRLIRGQAPRTSVAGAATSSQGAKLGENGTLETLPQRTLSVWKAKLSPVPAQPLGGGLNALLDVELPAAGIAPGARGEIVFSFGVERRGDYRVVLSNQNLNLVFEGNTEDELNGTRNPTTATTARGPGNQTVARSGGAGGNGGQNGGAGDATSTGGNVSPASAEVAEGIVIEGTIEDDVPVPVVPSAKAS